ncbi:MAG: DinB family protein [Chitinophagales bacterium]|nr:DinB family protein [Chitinophagales bacterium]
MKQTADALLTVLEEVLPLLKAIPDDVAAVKPVGKWSKKEIVGHLLDSASNNQHKFVRTMQAEGHLDFVGYAQDFWVSSQQYQTESWENLITFWEAFNRHLAHVIRHTPESTLSNTISINGSQSFTLAFIMEDYVEHLKHHLKQILPDAAIESAFANVYNT